MGPFLSAQHKRLSSRGQGFARRHGTTGAGGPLMDRHEDFHGRFMIDLWNLWFMVQNYGYTYIILYITTYIYIYLYISCMYDIYDTERNRERERFIYSWMNV